MVATAARVVGTETGIETGTETGTETADEFIVTFDFDFLDKSRSALRLLVVKSCKGAACFGGGLRTLGRA